MEKFAIILICLIPIVAFLLLVPSMLKGKKKERAQKSTPQTQTKADSTPKLEDESESKSSLNPIPAQEVKQDSKTKFDTPNFTKDDFRGYLKEKQTKITKPVKKETPLNNDMFETFSRFKQRKQAEKQSQVELSEKSILENMGDLSPEVATIIFTNILDRKF